MDAIHETFALGVDPRLIQTTQGLGDLIRRPSMLHLQLPPADESTYHNAQLTDYDPKQRSFSIVPPVRLRVQAFTSQHPKEMLGTAGFGFWNHAIAPEKRGLGRPQALWFFFGGAETNIALAAGVAGNGWKAASFDAKNPRFALLAPFAPLGVLLMRVPALYRRLWPIAQRALGVQEAALDAEMLVSEHEYRIDWRPDEATFYVDEALVLRVPKPPKQALGLIVWLDNQCAVVTPQGQVQFGYVNIPRRQALVITQLHLEPLAG